eukprot:6454755-Ditylum_brightwellii.AAC.1
MSERVGRDRGRERVQETMSTVTSTMAQVNKRTRFNKSTLTIHSKSTNHQQQEAVAERLGPRKYVAIRAFFLL